MFTILNDYLINIPLIANSKLISIYNLGSEDWLLSSSEQKEPTTRTFETETTTKVIRIP